VTDRGDVPPDRAGSAQTGYVHAGVRHWHVPSTAVVDLRGDQPWARSMNATASPTVLRFLTSSSGMETPNFSSAATTTSTIDSESTSRSSTNDLSSWTSSASMPATSLTISARSARISSVVAIWWFLFLLGVLLGGVSLVGPWSGNGDDLSGVRQAGTEGDEERGVAGAGLA